MSKPDTKQPAAHGAILIRATGETSVVAWDFKSCANPFLGDNVDGGAIDHFDEIGWYKLAMFIREGDNLPYNLIATRIWAKHEIYGDAVLVDDVKSLDMSAFGKIVARADELDYKAWKVRRDARGEICTSELIRMASEGLCTRCRKAAPQKMKCGACHEPTYCSRECQKADWKYHKSACLIWRGSAYTL